MEKVTLAQQRVDGVLYTRTDMPGVGVLRIAFGLFMPMIVHGKVIEPFYTNADKHIFSAFKDEEAAWHFLRQQQEKEAWHASE